MARRCCSFQLAIHRYQSSFWSCLQFQPSPLDIGHSRDALQLIRSSAARSHVQNDRSAVRGTTHSDPVFGHSRGVERKPSKGSCLPARLERSSAVVDPVHELAARSQQPLPAESSPHEVRARLCLALGGPSMRTAHRWSTRLPRRLVAYPCQPETPMMVKSVSSLKSNTMTPLSSSQSCGRVAVAVVAG